MSWVGSALDLGSRVREFEPRISDHLKDPQLQSTYDKELVWKTETSGFDSHKLMGLVVFKVIF